MRYLLGHVMVLFSLERLIYRVSVSQFISKTRRMSSGSASGIYSIAFVTIKDMPSAQMLSKTLFEKNLVACVNMIPGVQSMYRYEGNLMIDGEVLMMIKTRTSKLAELCELIKAEHPYDCPEFITTKIEEGNPAYLKWISENVPEN